MIKLPPKTEGQILNDVLKLFVNTKKFVDIGAADGWYTFLAAKAMPPESTIYGFEPVGFIFDKYKNTFVDSWKEQQWYLNKTFILKQEVVTSKEVDSVTFYKPQGKSGNISLSAVQHDGPHEESIIPATCIDNILQKDDTDCFIKIDVEGHEFDVLKGGEQYFTNCQNSTVLLEMHTQYLINQKIEPNDVLNFLKDRGYSCKRLAFECCNDRPDHNFLEWYVFKKF